MKTILQISVATAILMTNTALVAAQSDPYPDQNNYQCYQAIKADPAANRNVKVKDQFAGYGQYVADIIMVCNPVSIDGDRIPNEKAHLTCYSTDPNNDINMQQKIVAVANRFGEAKVAFEKVATILCVTSEKKHLN